MKEIKIKGELKMTKEEKKTKELYSKRRKEKIRQIRINLIEILVDDEIYLADIFPIIDDFCEKINDYLKN